MLTRQEQGDLLVALRKRQRLIPKSSRGYAEGNSLRIGALGTGFTKMTSETAETPRP